MGPPEKDVLVNQAGALGPLSTAVAAVQALIQHFHGRGLIIGGVAASVLAVPRFTNDVDAVLLIALDEIPTLLGVAAQHALVPRRTDAEQFARQNRVLLLRHEPTGINVDLSLGMLPFEEEAVDRGVNRDVGPLTLRLPTPEDLIIMKAVANRPIDLADIQAIIETHPDLDRSRVAYWVPQFAEVLERPEIWDDIARWFAR